MFFNSFTKNKKSLFLYLFIGYIWVLIISISSFITKNYFSGFFFIFLGALFIIFNIYKIFHKNQKYNYFEKYDENIEKGNLYFDLNF